MRYSPSTGSFYPETINYPNLPSDLIFVSDDDFARVMSRDPGYTYTVSPSGEVTLYPPPLSFYIDPIVGNAKNKGVNTAERLMWPVIEALAQKDDVKVAAYLATRAELLSFTSQPAIANATTVDGAKAAVAAAFALIAASAPADIQYIFD